VHPILLFQNVTVTVNVPSLIYWTIIGTVAGLLASLLFRGRRYGLITSVILGLIGAIVGGFLFQILGVQPVGLLGGNFSIPVIDVVAAFTGAFIILLIFGGLGRRYWR
jgi:uncharacterized membrane protein YeaQ/YmgE (transglycosylase-associated protein family)